jgi:Rrf2 family protein
MSKVFTLSEAGSIAIHGMVLIAREGEQMNVATIAELTGASRHHVAKVLQRLVKDDMLNSTRGPHGGFRLNRRPSEISLLEVYQSIEGTIVINDCPLDKHICAFDKCIIGNVVNKMTRTFRDYLAGQTLQDYI